MTMLPKYFSTLSLLLLSVTLPVGIEAYANWLKCYVDLDDTEIVMNQQIKTHEDADHVVDLKVKRQGGGGDWDWKTSNVQYPAGVTTTWKVMVSPPPELAGTNLQFVVETENFYNNGSKGDGSKFTFPKMCEGRRSFARNYNEGVTLEIDGTADSVEIWGAWAVGYGQVSLTPRLALMKGDAEDGEF